MEYLKTESNTEPLEFINRLEKMDKNVTKSSMDEFFTIYNTFIKEGSPKEINISGFSRERINNIIKEFGDDKYKWNNKESPYEILIPLKLIASHDLSDSFPRFVRSKVGEEIIKKHIKDPNVAKLTEAFRYPYYEKDFKIGAVLDRDVEFMTALLNDSFNWELVHGIKGCMNAWYCERNYLPNLKKYNFSLGKFDFIIPHSFETTILTLGTDYSKFDHNTNGVTIFNIYSADDIRQKYPEINHKGNRGCAIKRVDLKFTFPLTTPRVLYGSASIETTDQNDIIFLVKPNLDENILEVKDGKGEVEVYPKKGEPKVKKSVIQTVIFSIYRFTKIGGNKTKYSQAHIYDIGGWGSIKLLQKVSMKERGLETYNNIIKFIETHNLKEYTFKNLFENQKFQEQMIKESFHGQVFVDVIKDYINRSDSLENMK